MASLVFARLDLAGVSSLGAFPLHPGIIVFIVSGILFVRELLSEGEGSGDYFAPVWAGVDLLLAFSKPGLPCLLAILLAICGCHFRGAGLASFYQLGPDCFGEFRCFALYHVPTLARKRDSTRTILHFTKII